MIMESLSLVITLIVGTVFLGILSYAVIFRPDLRQRIIKFGQTPLAPWTKMEGAETILMLMIFLMLIAFSCTLCYVIYNLIQHSS